MDTNLFFMLCCFLLFSEGRPYRAQQVPGDAVQAAGAPVPRPPTMVHALACTKGSVSEFRGGDDDITE